VQLRARMISSLWIVCWLAAGGLGLLGAQSTARAQIPGTL